MSWRTSLVRRGPLILLGAVALVGGGLAWAAGPGAAGLIDRFADGQRVWRLGRLQLDGVRGPHLGQLIARRAFIRDASGEWLEARDLTLRWDPWALLSGRVAVDLATIDQAIVLRRPDLTATRPSNGPDLELHLERVAIGQLRLAPGVAGEGPALFALAGALDGRTDSLQSADLEVLRLDAPSDRLQLRFDAASRDSLRLDLLGAPGGAFAALLDLPAGEGISLAAIARGDAETGMAQAHGRVGAAPVLDLDLTWGADLWQGEARLAAAEIPLLADLAGRLGGPLQLQGQGDLPGAGGAFEISAAAPHLQLSLAGTLSEGLQLDGPAKLGAETEALGALAGQPELGGKAAFDGELRRNGRRLAVRGGLRLSELTLGEARVAAEGPLELLWGPAEALVESSLELAVAGQGPTTALLRALKLELDARYDRAEQALYLRRLRADGPNLELNASGALPQGGRISGRWALPRLAVLSPELTGAAGGQFVLLREPETLRFTADGVGRRLDGPDWLDGLLGDRPRLELEGVLQGEAVLLRRAVLRGPQLRAGASGALSGERLDLRLEGSLQGPLEIGGAVIEGGVDVAGSLEGPLSAPAIRLQAGLDTLDVAALQLQNAALNLRLDGGPERSGTVELQAALNGQPLSARAGLAVGEKGLALKDIAAQAGRLALSGNLILGQQGPEGALAVDGALGGLWPGVAGRLAGTLALQPTGTNEPRVQAEITLQRFRIGDRLRLQTARLEATGLLSDLSWQGAVEGQAGGLPLQLTAEGAAGLGETGPSLRAQLQGSYAQRVIATLEPITVRSAAGGLEAGGALRLDGGSVRFDATQAGDALDFDATLQRMPLTLLSAVSQEPLAGAVDGRIVLAGRGARLSGEAELQFDDVRFARRGSDPVDATLNARLADQRLVASLAAQSQRGLRADVDLRAPVVASAAPFALGLGEGSALADWRVNGPIGGVWDLVGSLDQQLTGVVQGQGRAELSPERISGTGELALTDAVFADKLTGLRLDDIDAALRFDPTGAELVRLSASGPGGGAVTGSGRVTGPEQGALTVQLANLLLVDRPDIRARADGDLRFGWDPRGSRLEGALTITEATLRIDELRDTALPSLEVVEINRPGDPPGLAARRLAAAARGAPLPEARDEEEAEELPETEAQADALGGPTQLALQIKAPRRIFTRGRGLDAEWALDLAVRGTLEDPQVEGVARLLRGSFSLAGRTFDLEDSSVIRFDGDPTDALVELAAENVGPDLTVRVELSGSVEDPDIRLSSNPSLPEDEILPQFLFGRSAGDLSPLEAAQLASSLATLAGRSSFDLVATTRNLVQLDRLDIRQEEAGVSVAGGRYITRGVYLELSRGALGETATKVEWQVRPRLYIVSSFLTNGDQRLSVRWRRDLGKVRAPR